MMQLQSVPTMQGIQKAFMTFKAIDTDPFAIKRPSVTTDAYEKVFSDFSLSRDKLSAKMVLGNGQVLCFISCSFN